MNDPSQTPTRRKTFDRLVPEPVRRELIEILRCESDPAARGAPFDAHDLARKYGVSRRQFKRFADRFPCLTEGPPVPTPPQPAPVEERAAPPAPSVVPEGYREWMTRAGTVLSTLARRLSADDPEGWERGVYLALLARVFAVLSGDNAALPVHEVLTVSRILLEHERAKGGASGVGRPAADSPKEAPRTPARSGSSAEVMRGVVRELYGVGK